MRIALLAWDLDREAIDAIGRLGVDVVAFTRWFEDEAPRESHQGWQEVRCPHQLGGGVIEEASAFGVGVVRTASTSGLGFDFDIVHAMDSRTRPAAGELGARGRASALVVASDRAVDEGEENPGFGPLAGPNAWIVDHPWGAERLRNRLGEDDEIPMYIIPTQASLAHCTDQEARKDAREEGACVVLTLRAAARFSSQMIVAGLKSARQKSPGLVAAVFGTSPRCESLRRRLKAEGLLSARWGESCTPTTARWNEAISQASVVGTAAPDLIDEPIARASWLLGAPVFRIHGRDPEVFAGEVLDALFDRDRREVDVRLALTLEGSRIDADGAAAEWMRIYLRLLDRKRTAVAVENRPAQIRSESPPLAFPELRSRLTLTPVSPHEATASWTVRPDDWRSALEWLGPEAVRAILTIRLFDVTDVAFDGLNAHGTFDVDLGPNETHRMISVPFDGRSLAACLGVRSRWGYFHPLAHARICHLPREAPTRTPPTRRLRVAPRRPTG